MKTLIGSALLYATLIASGATQAALVDRGGGLIYDSVLNITWLDLTHGYDNFNSHFRWANTLVYHDSVRNQDLSGWRLPNTWAINGGGYNVNFSVDGSTDFGYNQTAPGSLHPGSTASELAYLFYNDLGNKAYLGTDGQVQAGYGLVNTGPFRNLLSSSSNGSYFSSYARFELSTGAQLTGTNSILGYGFALAVRPGDVPLFQLLALRYCSVLV